MPLSPESGYLPISRDKQYCLCQDSAPRRGVVTHCKRGGVPAFTRVCQALRDVLVCGGSHTQRPPSLYMHAPVPVFLPGKGGSLTPHREEG